MQTSTDHLHFAVLAADVALFTVKDDHLLVRMVNVHRPPFFTNVAGLPGGLLQPTETAEEAIERHIREKAKITAPSVHIEQLYTFSQIDRDPRGRVVAVAYIGLIPWNALSEKEQSNTPDVSWQPVHRIKTLAYDHQNILQMAVKRLQSRVTYTTLISKLMPREFTLTELQNMYQTVLGTSLDKRNFRKKLLKLKIVKPLRKERSDGPWRPAQLFTFTSKHIQEIEML